MAKKMLTAGVLLTFFNATIVTSQMAMNPDKIISRICSIIAILSFITVFTVLLISKKGKK